MPRAGLPLDPLVEVCEVDPWCSTCIAAGRLKGLVQTVPRAEAIAVWAALEYVHQVSRPARLWCDCQFVVDRMQSILQGGFRWDPSQTDAHDGEGLLPPHEEALPEDEAALHGHRLRDGADLQAAGPAPRHGRGEPERRRPQMSGRTSAGWFS